MFLNLIFDEINKFGNEFIYDYFSNQFSCELIKNDSEILKRLKEIDSQLVLTNSLDIACTLNLNKVANLLYLNNNFNSFTFDNSDSWRRNLIIYQNILQIYAPCRSISKSFSQLYKIPCKVQLPVVPEIEKEDSDYILYNIEPPYMFLLDRLNEKFVQFNNIRDFQRAKLYIHTPEPNEQWNINIPIAHSAGVACVVFKQGVFSDFCTNVDKILPLSIDSKNFINQIKVAIRDCNINSKIVKNMSQRFRDMNEIQQKIKQVLRQNNVRGVKPLTFSEIQKNNSLSKLQSRPKAKSPVSTHKHTRPPKAIIKEHDWSDIYKFINNNTNIYAGCGGLGDALLLLALANSDPKAKIIFGVNGGSKEIIHQLFNTFEIESLVTRNFNGTNDGIKTWNSILDHKNFKGAAHIPRDLNYGDWGNNTEEYIDKMAIHFPFVPLLGKLINLRATKKVIGLSPRGSDHHSTWKQRYLSKEEYNRIIKYLLSQESTVLVFGSENDLSHYGVYPDNNVIFMSSEFAVSYPAPKYSINLRHMMSAINSCDYIYSVDTWLKTYAGLADIPCTVIMSRYNGTSKHDYSDPSDKIFLNSCWNFKIESIEDILNKRSN